MSALADVMDTQYNGHVKTCSVCALVKPRTEFYRRVASPDGLAPLCRECSRAKSRAYQVAHRDEARVRHAAWRVANEEHNRLEHQRWYKANKYRLSEEYKQKYATDPEYSKIKAHEWSMANPERRAAIRRKWRETHSASAIAAVRRRQERLAGVPVADFTDEEWPAVLREFNH